MPESSVNDFKLKAVEYLSRREHSKFELQNKLSERLDCSLDHPNLLEALEQLEAENLLSDQRCADALVRSGLSKGHGPNKIKQSMRSKGLESSLLYQCDDFKREDWFSLAEKVRNKRFGSDLPLDYQAKAKQMRFLSGRGFLPEHIEFAFSSEK